MDVPLDELQGDVNFAKDDSQDVSIKISGNVSRNFGNS